MERLGEIPVLGVEGGLRQVDQREPHGVLGWIARKSRGGKRSRNRWLVGLEPLEPRCCPTGLTTNPWRDLTTLTFSFVPDGTPWGAGVSQLQSRFDARFPDGAWKHEIERAIQTWAVVLNLDLSERPDSGLAWNTPGRAQDDARFGDIRIGGTTTLPSEMLASTTMPDPYGSPTGGDIQINLSQNWGIGEGFDLYSVMLHEIGHSLGLEHDPDSSHVMYERYSGIQTGLSQSDIAQAQKIYGPRVADQFNQAGQGVSFAKAVPLNSLFDPSGVATVANVGLARIGETDIYALDLPVAGSRVNLNVAVKGKSLLSAQLTIQDAAGKVLASRSSADRVGEDVQLTLPSLASGRYYVSVTGATADLFGIGDYDLTLEAPGLTSVAHPTPRPVPVPTPPSGGSPRNLPPPAPGAGGSTSSPDR